MKVMICYIFLSVSSLMMSMASALTTHWVVGRSSCRGHTSNGTDFCFKVLTWNHNGIKGKQFLPREKVAATGWQITRAFCQMSTEVHQFARMHPGMQFVMINYNEQTEICKRLNV